MRIAQLAPLVESVPPRQYGGTELIVSLLTEGLVERGHEVTLFASGDSVTGAELVPVTGRSLRSDASIPVRRWQAYDLRLLLELKDRQNEFDVVHNHMGYQALPFLKDFSCATVTTIHNPVKDYCAPIFLRHKDLPFVAISEAHRRLNYPSDLNYVATIYNGIDLDRHASRPEPPRTYLLFIGRICRDKGTATAIEIARELGLPLKIAGKIDQSDRGYFRQQVEPWLNSQSVEYVGEVGFAQKLELYSRAIAVLYPIAFDEPFGLVMAESLAAGTPVAAFNRGAVGEIVTDGRTGIIGDTAEDLISRFGEIEGISPDACRQHAGLFSSQRMLTEYERLYKNLCL